MKAILIQSDGLKDVIKSAFKKEERWFFWYFLLYLVIIWYLYAFLHEFGHYIVIIALGLEVTGIHIPLIPYSENAFITYITNRNLATWEEILIDISGSLFTLIIAIVLFIIVYFRKLDKRLEYLLILTSFSLSLDYVFYNLFDVFFLQYGDWYMLYEIAPYMNFIFILLGFIMIFLMIYHRYKIAEKIDI